MSSEPRRDSLLLNEEQHKRRDEIIRRLATASKDLAEFENELGMTREPAPNGLLESIEHARRGAEVRVNLIALRDESVRSPSPKVQSILSLVEELKHQEVTELFMALTLIPKSMPERVFRAYLSSHTHLYVPLIFNNLLRDEVRALENDLDRRTPQPRKRERDQLIVKLHETDRLSFGKIADRLNDLRKKKDKLLTDGAVKRAYYREKERQETERQEREAKLKDEGFELNDENPF